MEAITSFRGEYGFLSNFHSCYVEFDGLTYGSSEAAFQAAKTTVISERLDFTRYSAKESKREGRKLTLRDDWKDVQIYIMHEICKAKFKNNPDLRRRLSDTYPKQLIEGNNWNDTFWGCVNGEGSNFLGRILMIIRDEIILEDSSDVSETMEDLISIDGY